jgi:drug/metabolite transporter (DMT)-like permease
MVGVAVMWGAAFPLTKPAMADATPVAFTWLRFALVSLLLLPLAVVAHRRATGRAGLGVDRRTWPRLVAAGLLGYVVTQISQNWALSLSPSADVAIIAATQPVWIVTLGAVALREPAGRPQWAGLGACLAGVLLVSGVNPLQPVDGGGWQRPVGDLIFLLGSLCWAVYNLLNRPLGERNPPVSTVAAMSLVALGALTPLALAEAAGWLRFAGVTAPSPPAVTGALLGGVVYSAVPVTVIGLLVLLVAYRRLTVAQVAATFYISPLTGVVIAVAWLGEPAPPSFLIGALLILAGVALTTRGRPNPSTEA